MASSWKHFIPLESQRPQACLTTCVRCRREKLYNLVILGKMLPVQCTLPTVKARKLNFGDHFFRDNAHSVGEAIGLNSSLLSGPIMQRSHNTDWVLPSIMMRFLGASSGKSPQKKQCHELSFAIYTWNFLFLDLWVFRPIIGSRVDIGDGINRRNNQHVKRL